MKKRKEFVLLVDGVEVKCSTASKIDIELPRPILRMFFKFHEYKLYQLRKLVHQIKLVNKRYFNEVEVDVTAGYDGDDFVKGKVTLLIKESI